ILPPPVNSNLLNTWKFNEGHYRMKFLEMLHNPEDEYTPISFWFLNGNLSDAEIIRQMEDFAAHCVSGVVLHPRMGLLKRIRYLSKTFFVFIRTAVETDSKHFTLYGLEAGQEYAVQDCIVPCLLAVSVGYNDDGVPAPEPPYFENFTYERVTVTGRSLLDGWNDCKAIEFVGFDETHPIRNVLFKDVTITGGLGVSTELCEDLREVCIKERCTE
ncbi:MAG: hypothetical protein LUF30_06115, partial [Lachnospiraceae bacterium]|nr:hypothetical protein [Lachnospiraceae bacterium]